MCSAATYKYKQVDTSNIDARSRVESYTYNIDTADTDV